MSPLLKPVLCLATQYQASLGTLRDAPDHLEFRGAEKRWGTPGTVNQGNGHRVCAEVSPRPGQALAFSATIHAQSQDHKERTQPGPNPCQSVSTDFPPARSRLV